MAGNWLNRPPGWAVSLATGNVPTGTWKRFVVTAPNKRRWEIRSKDGAELRELAWALHRLGLCCAGDPLDAELPAGLIPTEVQEIQQRQCRDCSRVRVVEDFTGAARSCKGCAWTINRGYKVLEICPACAEPRPPSRLVEVDGLGLACPSCATEARRARERVAIEVVVVRPPLEPLRPRPVVEQALTTAAPTDPPALRLPQIRDFGRLRALLDLVRSGVVGAREIGVRMGSKPSAAARHASFYRQAAEILGLLEVGRWALTPLGERLLATAAGGHAEREVLRDAVKGAASLGPLVGAVLSTRAPDLGGVVAEVVALLPKLSRATIERRVRDTLSWRTALGLAPVARAKRKPAKPQPQLELWTPSVSNLPLELPPVRAEDFEQMLPACVSW